MDLPAHELHSLFMPLLRLAPPWVVLAVLAGVAASSSFFLMAGRGFRSLPTYLMLGLAVAPLCQAIGAGLPSLPPPLAIGEVNLAFILLGTWLFLAMARALRL